MKSFLSLILAVITFGSMEVKAYEFICNLKEMKGLTLFIQQNSRGSPLNMYLLDNLNNGRPLSGFSDVLGTLHPISFSGRPINSEYFKRGILTKISINEDTGKAKIKVGKRLLKKRLNAECTFNEIAHNQMPTE